MDDLVILGGIFAIVSVAAFAVIGLLSRSPVRARLERVKQAGRPEVPARQEWQQRAKQMADPIARLAQPKEGWEGSPLKLRFANAGYRGDGAPVIYFAAKVLGTLVLPISMVIVIAVSGAKLSMLNLLAVVLVVAAIGYYSPNAILSHLVARRQRDIFEGLPDAADLLVICVEAGLGLDAALQRVAQEVQLRSAAMADELQLVTYEIRAGSSRERALKNLALRTGVDDVDSLTSMLVQADRFGTSVAQALRVYSDMLRTKRRQRAEEMAAKIPVKLLFPLIFCIFPSLLLVLLGPAVIQIYRILLPTLSGTSS